MFTFIIKYLYSFRISRDNKKEAFLWTLKYVTWDFHNHIDQPSCLYNFQNNGIWKCIKNIIVLYLLKQVLIVFKLKIVMEIQNVYIGTREVNKLYYLKSFPYGQTQCVQFLNYLTLERHLQHSSRICFTKKYKMILITANGFFVTHLMNIGNSIKIVRSDKIYKTNKNLIKKKNAN